MYCDGALVGSYRSDGMILATPTGSTAYSFSAGGPILDAAADVLVLTPVCAHNVHAAPLVFAADRHLKIIADAENRDGSFACADSSAQCDLLPGESLLVTGGGQHLQNAGGAWRFDITGPQADPSAAGKRQRQTAGTAGVLHFVSE